ncbi:hypothetical protein [Halobacterium sp. R2-5]|uniref:hypothetical protein n=1 Tax=Halobacterium sp. R2-5 TaxID=2715751 RepID=UPI0014213D63|nr:hypothetical protein [Halobacterium sp. R2-5]NIB99760.1 hypothetical protein [Halobacterium sp. R2-5]
MRRRERAAAVAAALAAVGVSVVLDAPSVSLLPTGALYAATGFYVARYPDVLGGGSERPKPDWVAGALGGGLTLGLFGLTTVNAPPWLLVYGFGLASFGFAVGVAWARSRPEPS